MSESYTWILNEIDGNLDKNKHDFDSPVDILSSIESILKKNIINRNPKPAISIELMSNHVDKGIPGSYSKYHLCKTTCGQHFIGICRGGKWMMKSSLQEHEDTPVPEDLKVEWWVDLN